jgi:hypothetical protein
LPGIPEEKNSGKRAARPEEFGLLILKKYLIPLKQKHRKRNSQSLISAVSSLN